MPGMCEKFSGDVYSNSFWQSVKVVVCATTLLALGLVPIKNLPKINLKCDTCNSDSVSVSSTEGTGKDMRSFLDAIADMKRYLNSKFDNKIGEVAVKHKILSAGSGAEGVVWEVSLVGTELLGSAKGCMGSATEAAR